MMEKLIGLLISLWFWLALAMSLYWGIRALILFAQGRNWCWKSYQFIFNFIGSFAGWCCFYALLVRTRNNIPSFQGFTSGDVVLFIISLLGLTGHLPEVTYGLVRGFGELGKKVLEKLYNK